MYNKTIIEKHDLLKKYGVFIPLDELLDRLSEIFLSEYLRTEKQSYKVYKSNE